jgi:Ca2+-binding EF-hand superfamily protein
MADRMYTVMDRNRNGYLQLHDYLSYIDVMMYGDEEERLIQSFELMDIRGQGEITFAEFRNIINSFAQMWSAALGQPTPVNLIHFKHVFERLADRKPFFNYHDFKRVMERNPNTFNWFSKPEKAMFQRVKEYGRQTRKKLQSHLVDL